MNFESLNPGKDIPNDVNVIIEIPSRSDPVKYEVDKSTGLVMVDRFVGTSMSYPCDYGFIPKTLSEDGDPVDVLVITPYPLYPGVMIRCRPIGVLLMTDESGPDAKILAVPVDKLTTCYQQIKEIKDLGEELPARIIHFFQHYKDLEQGKWVKIEGWKGLQEAHREIESGVKRYQDKLA